jgi:Asp-tRNA(Asn)/Glu-tRNA(Gln) amidotransferase C subunit
MWPTKLVAKISNLQKNLKKFQFLKKLKKIYEYFSQMAKWERSNNPRG